jgi:hypothetical protein
MRPPLRERLPEGLTLMTVALEFGLDPSSFDGTHYLCPFYNDQKKGNLRFYDPHTRDGHFYCFSCQARRDQIDWVRRSEKVAYVEAYKLMRGRFGLGVDELLESAAPPVVPGGVRLFKAHCLSEAEIEQLAGLRKLNPSVIRMVDFWKVLRIVANYKGQKAYVLLDPKSRVAVVRRLDGELWGGRQKALLAPNSIPGIPIGIHAIAKYSRFVLVEGGPDYLRLVSVGAKVDIWIAPKIHLPNGGVTKDLDDLYWKLDPNIRGKLRELHNLINFDVGLFPTPRIASADFRQILP